ncbi:hypothetical protein PT974_00375 [Cladobotryum mycophilum]|uniref:Chromosome segregation ATPase family protein n=1 Tax=Cladobotryum mycophilum TaxID=491253 RepID=A0ABR0T0M7_9HYPO
MPHPERGLSIDGERYLRHQHSASSDQGVRALIPMWDSSDPERAPPPLPLNPQSPSLSSRAGTSSAIASAHAALSERVRESNTNSTFVPPVTKRTHESPERVSMNGRTGSHRRLQSSSVRDISMMLEHGQSPGVAPSRSPERQQYRPTTPTSMREGQGAFLERTPPQSSTMLALQNMSSGSPTKDSGEPPLSNITNGQKPNSSLENLSTQILGLTNIAQSLQREMAALSRRSRDNATDLLSLKEATNTRDEDIRKSLRDLLGNITDQSARLAKDSFGGYYIENKATSPTSGRTYTIPRMGSPKSFAESLDRASISTPSLVGGDNSSIALLEKILRGLGTRDGQESLVNQLAELSDKLTGMATAAKVDELVDYVRSQSETAMIPINNAYIPRRMSIDEATIDLDSSPMAQRLLKNGDARSTSGSQGRGVNILNEDVLNIIRSVKDSVAQSGGLTAEVKALVRELRGEVLGMGRELGKRLENIGRRPVDETDPAGPSANKDDVSRVIDEGLEQMKEQLNHVLREHRRQSATADKQKNLIDYSEVYNALRNALKDNDTAKGVPDLSRDDVMEAVREAWENYKPEIEVQQIGLERHEVLECLKQGFHEYESRHQSPPGASRDEVFTAVVEGLKHFVPPQVDTPASVSRDEIMDAVRECLEEFEFPLAPSTGGDLTREDMIYAVKEGLNDLDLSRSNALVPTSNSNGEIMDRLHDLMDTLKLEFRLIAEDSKDNATKGGLENLRAAIEGYVDRAAGVSTQEDFMENLASKMDHFKDEVSNLVTTANSKSRQQLQAELEGLRDIVNSSMIPALPQSANFNSEEFLDVLRNGLSNLRQEILRPRPETTEILDALNEGLNEIRAGIDRMTHKPTDLTANDEILDALKTGLDSVRSGIETIRDTSNDGAIMAYRDPSSDMALVPAEVIKQNDIKNLEVLITQLRVKVETMGPNEESIHKSDLNHLEEMLRNLQKSVDEIKNREPSAPVPEPAAAREIPEKTAEDKPEEPAETTRDAPAVTPKPAVSGDIPSREDVEAIETIVRNTKSRLDEFFDGDQTVRKEHIDNVEALILDTRETMRSLNTQVETKMEAMANLSQKDDVSNLATLVTKLSEGLDEMKGRAEKDLENPEKVTKHDVESVEAVALEIKTAVEGLAAMDLSAISTKEDFGKLEAVLREAKATFDSYNETSSKALAERQTEIGGVSERVAEVKTFLEEFQTELKTKLEEGSTGAEALRKLIESMGEKIDKNETVGADVKDMFELMKAECEISKEAIGGSRIEANEKLEQATENIRSKIDDKVAELIAKHDHLHSMLDEKAQAAEARDILTEASLSGTKALTEELKLLIDTLGATVTESLEKMEEASKSVFTKVEEFSTRTDEQYTEGKTEHQQTRDQVKEALTAVETLQGGVNEVQPQILDAVKNILQLVGDHFEHSKTSTTDLQGKIEAQPTSEAMQAMIPQPEKYDDAAVREKLEHIIENKYDDTVVHEKLDKIVEHNDGATQAFTRLETLDKVHESVVRSAAELSEFIAAQMQHNNIERDDREKTLHETTVALGKAQTEKDAVELTVLRLRDEEEQLRKSTMALRIENESLIKQRTRLTGDVSSLETALRLRKDELFEMEHRAEGLERRILNGIMDHSRVLLYGKAGKSGAEAMNRKRVKKPAGEEDEESGRSSPRPAVPIVLSKSGLSSPGKNGATRRIASLSQMNSKQTEPNMQRSQSVRTQKSNNTHRKRSWGGAMSTGDLAEESKENAHLGETVEEIDEVDTSHIKEEDPPVDDISVDGSVEEEEIDDDEVHEVHGEIEEEEVDDDDDDDDDEMEEEIDEDGVETEETLRRVSIGSTVITNHGGIHEEVESTYDASEYEESIDGDDDDDAVLVD